MHGSAPNSLSSRGFTTIELMVVVAIAAVLAAIAMPSFRDVLERYRVRRAVEDFTATFYLARTEAIKRGGRVTILKANPRDPQCAGSLWSCGWNVIEDLDEDGVQDEAEQVLQRSDFPANVAVDRPNKNDAAMKINRWGEVGAGMLHFDFSYRRTADLAMHRAAVCVSGGGRLTVNLAGDTCL